MTQLNTIRTKTGAALAAVGVASLLAACGSSGHANNSGYAGSGTSAAAVSATPASDHQLKISIASGHAGRYLTGAGGRAIYLWVADHHDRSVCSGACAVAWPPLLTKSKPAAGSGVKAGDLGTISHRGGERQVTYNGHPLYYYAGDTHRGSTTGQGSDGFGAKWWLVSPSGAAITSHGGSSASSSSSSSSGGWG